MPWVYPRVCGAIYFGYGCDGEGEGLSPRVRGNRHKSLDRPFHVRSIPACAGQSDGHIAMGKLGGVYPRVCGAIIRRRRANSSSLGLSPRVRGNLGQSGATLRPTPARAVYPRVCGAIPGSPGLTASTGGLSPRVRGNRASRPLSLFFSRSIPACAGQSTQQNRQNPPSGVYPRVCGAIR